MNISARRAGIGIRNVAKRDNDMIQKTFMTCHNAHDLPHLHGLTRSARYKARLEDMFSHKHYHPELAAQKMKSQAKH